MSRRPSTKTMVMGHPVIAVPVMLAGGVTMYAAYEGSNLLVGFLGLAMVGTAQSARAQVSAYKAWQRDWDAMAPQVPRERKRTSPWTWIGLIIAVISSLAWLGGANLREIAVDSGLMAGSVWLTAAIWVAMRWVIRRRRRPAGSSIVTVVARPAMAIPSLEDAYRALPPYCHALLRGRT